MPNREEHLSTSIILGSSIGIIENIAQQTKHIELGHRQDYDIGEIILKTINQGIYSGIGGLINDLLEPATSPSHRKFFHSFTFLLLLILLISKLESDEDISEIVRTILKSMGLGSAVHILQDSQTPMGIPFI